MEDTGVVICGEACTPKVSTLIRGCEFLCAFMCGFLHWWHSQKVTVGLPGVVDLMPSECTHKAVSRMDRPFPPRL